MKKPDRFARVVQKVQRKDDWGIDCVSSDEVIELLRAEHRAVVRLVKRVLNDELYYTTSARRFKLVILAAMARRIK